MRQTNSLHKSYDAKRCPRCENFIADEKVCSCGSATANMSFAERAKFEVEQWRAYKARETASA